MDSPRIDPPSVPDLEGSHSALPRAETLLDSVTDAVCVLDQDWRYVYMNVPYAEIIIRAGREPGTLLGRVIWDVFPEIQDTAFYAETMRAARERVTTEYIEHYAPIDAWFGVRVYPTPEGVIVTARDVTADVRARHALERAVAESERRAADLAASEARFRAVFEQAAVGVARVAPNGAWLDVNRRFAAMLGYAPEEMAGLDFARITHPDERERDLAAARRLLAGEMNVYQVEKRYIHRDGHIVWAQLTTAFVREPPDDGYFVSIIEDISERRRAREELTASEARYRALIEATSQMVWTTAPDGQFVEEQPAWAAYTGQTFDEYRGWGWIEAIHPDDRDRTATVWSRSVESATLCETEYRVRRADGEYRWFQVRAVPVRDAAGAVGEWVGVETEVTDAVRRRQRATLLVTAGALLARTATLSEWPATLAATARAAVGDPDRPGVADGCLITLVQEDGSTRTAALASANPSDAELIADIDARFPLPADAPFGYPAVIRSGEPQLFPAQTLDETVLPALARDAEHLELLRRLHMYSGLCVPLIARGRTLGALSLVLTGRARRPALDERDLTAAEELGRRLALALDGTRLVAELTEANERLATANLRLESHTRSLVEREAELRLANEQLQDQATEMEAQAEELQATAAQLEERTEAAERAEREAQTAREHLARTFAQAPVAVAVLEGPEHRFTLANPLFEALAPARPLVGRSARDGFLGERPADFAGLLDRVYRTGEAVASSEYPVRYRPENGTDSEERVLDILYQPLRDADLRVYGIAVVAADVTSRVRSQTLLAGSERQLRTLADAIPTLAWTARADGYIDWYNARWYEYTGTTPAQMEGWGWQSVHDPDALPSVLARWRRSIETGEPFEMTFPLRGADGIFRQFLTRVSPVRDSAGRVVRWFGTNTDVEIERVARAEAEAARRSAEEANRAKMDFLATMSHELRTPLNAIAGYTELLSVGVHGPVTPEQEAVLGRIQRSQRHLLGLINDVLNFAKLEAGRVEYHLSPVAVRETIEAIEPLISPQLGARGLRFGCDMPGAELVVRADRDKLQQILLNLLSNAIKFTPQGGTVDLVVRPSDDQVSIAVRDTGVGIPPDRLEQVFAPFVQVDRRLNTQHEGVGLGLAISRDLARGMQGEISVESEPGVGSTFTLSLPRVRG